MLSSIGAQSTSTDKDKERIDAARARNIARTNRFLDARQRTIGLDLDVLDQQMRDRRAREAKEKMAAANEFRRNENLYRQVALQEAEEKRLRDEEFAQLRKEWQAQMELNARQKVEEKKLVLSGVDRDVCGTSSAQILVGEDLDYPARKLLQQQQMRAWSEQHSAENRARKNAERAEMAAYWAYLTKMNETQAELSEEERAFREALNASIEEENMRLAAEKEENNAKWKENDERANAEEFRFREILLCEDDDVIANHQHTAPQEYKGFTLKQKAEVVQSNVDMRAERLRMKEKQRQEDENWYLHQEKLRGIMEEQAHDEYRLRKEAEAQLMKDLREQQLQAQERSMEDRESSFGKIAHTHGMYAGFGKSCR